MEIYSILTLASILAFIFFLTFFLNAKQKKQLNKHLAKQEPRLNSLSESASHVSIQSDVEVSNEIDFGDSEVDLLSDDPLLRPKQTLRRSPETELARKPASTGEKILYLMIAAKPNKPYAGYELLQSLLAAGLRFGTMNLFHRYEDNNGNGKILFSVASASEPGSFEISKMGAYSGKGLVMFLRLTHSKDLMFAFDTLLETAKQLVEDLDGDILDDEKKPLTSEKLEKMRKIILEFEQKQVIGDLFD